MSKTERVFVAFFKQEQRIVGQRMDQSHDGKPLERRLNFFSMFKKKTFLYWHDEKLDEINSRTY